MNGVTANRTPMITPFQATGVIAGTKNSSKAFRMATTMPFRPSSTTIGNRIRASVTPTCPS